ncbi:MAG TPA: alcohol dehydrogenase catalytic domain-containing protein [Anaerolineales bacterium]|nr:alcohol dehydrogenase catalytic domain-containing protein [Anaerolineales bacterium]
MKAAFLSAPGKIEISETSVPPLGGNEVLIKPMRAGICGSDVSLFTGHRTPSAYPLLPGHEVVGLVTAVGENVTQIAIGQRVTVEPNYPCGVCTYCHAGRGNICPNKKSLGVTISGCFAEQFAAPAEFVWPIPDAISNEDAVTIEPLAVSLHALWQSGAQIGDTVAVLGCGSTGLLLIQAAVSQGMRVFAHDIIESKIDMARQLGAQVSQNPDISELWRNEGVTSVFECAGATATVELALNAVPRGGQIILLGLSSCQASFTPLKFVREELRVSGSIIYDHPTDFARTIALVEKKVLSPRKIISHTFPFKEISQALQLASTGEAGKVLLTMEA